MNRKISLALLVAALVPLAAVASEHRQRDDDRRAENRAETRVETRAQAQAPAAAKPKQVARAGDDDDRNEREHERRGSDREHERHERDDDRR